MNDNQPDPVLKEAAERLEIALHTLDEHFDSVLIIATRYDGGEDRGTLSLSKGSGNWHARYGSAKEYIVRMEFDFLRQNQVDP